MTNWLVVVTVSAPSLTAGRVLNVIFKADWEEVARMNTVFNRSKSCLPRPAIPG